MAGRWAGLAAVLALCGMASGAARAELVVTGPDDASVQTVGEWYRGHVPACFRTRTRVMVDELTDRQMTAYLDGGAGGDTASHTEDTGDIDGVFENDPPRIRLRLTAGQTPDVLTFAHEYGHYVWFDLLTESDRRRYAKLYARQKAAHRLVTEYAADSPEEGFAEAFAYYLDRPAALAKKDAESAHFLTRWQADHS